MGIPGLKTWVYKRYPEAFVKTLPDPQEGFTDVYIDMAAQFHMVLRKARNEAHLFRLLQRRLDECLTVANPQRRVVFALDGPAPLAKLVEQRNRRKKEAFKEERIHAQPPSSVSSSTSSTAVATAATGTGAAVPHMALTTGTTLMLDIHQCLISFIVKQLAKPNRAHLQFELSDSRVCGEGELKILARLLQKNVPQSISSSLSINNNNNNDSDTNNNNESNSGGRKSRERHLVIGGDSDLLLMVMASGRDHVYVAPNLEFPRRYKGGSGGGKSNPFNTPASTAIFSRDAAVAHWRKTHLAERDGTTGTTGGGGGDNENIINTASSSSSQLDITSLALDLSLLAIVSSGNDYLPGVSGLNLGWWGSRPGLWDLYLDMRQREEWAGQSLVMRTCQCTADIFLDSFNTTGNGTTVITDLEGDGSGDNMSSINTSEDDDESEGENANMTASQRRRRRKRRNKASFPACENLANMTVSINRPMLAALFKRYHEQRNLAGGGPPSKNSNSNSNAGARKKSTIGGVKKISSGSNKNGSSSTIWHMGSSPKDDATFFKFEVSTQNGTDIENYIQCLEWVLHMYSTGTVADWRLAYDAPTPDLVTFMQQLYDTSQSLSSSSSVSSLSLSEDIDEASAVAIGSGTIGIGNLNGYSSEEPPLIPAACALALLPRTGRHLIAPPLRPLMDPDSVLYDLYHVCQECKTLGKKMTAVQKSYTLASLEVSTLQGKFDLVKNADQKKAEELGRTLDHAEKKYSKLKAKLATFSREKAAHMAEMHPQKAFPIEALERAVAEISPAAYSDAYRRLAYFGEEFVFFNDLKALQKSNQQQPVAAPGQQRQQQGDIEERRQGQGQGQGQGMVMQHKPEWVRECIRFAQKNRIQMADVSPVRRKQLHPFPYMDKSLSSSGIGSSMNSGGQNKLQQQQQGSGMNTINTNNNTNNRNTGMLVKDSLGPIARMACQLLPQRRRILLLKNQSGAAALLKQSASQIRTFFG